MKKILNSLVFKLLVAVVLGIVIGILANEPVMNVVVTIKSIFSQLVLFAVPLIIIGFIAPSIAQLKNNASKLLTLAVGIAYLSSVGARGFFCCSRIFDYPPNAHFFCCGRSARTSRIAV